jgi:hypothetical protein
MVRSLIAAAVLTAATAPFGATTAAARPPSSHCASVRVDRFLHPSPKGDFGAFDVTATGTTCRTADAVASYFIGHPRLAELKSATVQGFTCRLHYLQVSQRIAESCTRGGATVHFQDEIPNG